MSRYETDGLRASRASALANAIIRCGGNLDLAIRDMIQPEGLHAPMRHPKLKSEHFDIAEAHLRQLGHHGWADDLARCSIARRGSGNAI
jgi:hypothetical protein